MSEYGRYVCYILASRKYGPLYIGVTSNLLGRVVTHRDQILAGFTSRYNIKRLVYFEQFDRAADAIAREKQLKKWNRDWKIALIEKSNPDWDDLYDTLLS